MGKTRKKRDRKVFPVTEGASGYTKKTNVLEESSNDESKEELLQRIIRQLQDGEEIFCSLRLFVFAPFHSSSSLARVARVRSSELCRPHLGPRRVIVAWRHSLELQARPPFRARAQARSTRWPSHGVAKASEVI